MKTSDPPPRKSFVSRIPPLGRSGSSEFKGASETKALNLFYKYRDHEEDAILGNGVESLCLDLELKPEEFKVLIFAWRCNVEQMCRFSRFEFLTGCRALKTDTIRTLQNRLPEAVTEVMSSRDLFKDLYRFTFRFGLEPGQKVLPVEMAVSLWQLVRQQDGRRGFLHYFNVFYRYFLNGNPLFFLDGWVSCTSIRRSEAFPETLGTCF